MIIDPDNRYIQALRTQATLENSKVYEVGCGDGRLTRELACFAERVVAIDCDSTVVKQARHSNHAANIEFHNVSQLPQQFGANFDLLIYSLSLHHIPPSEMLPHLVASSQRLNRNGRILVIEPAEQGSFMELKRRFGAGSGDESLLIDAAAKALQQLPGWQLSPPYLFEIDLLFRDQEDLVNHKLKNHPRLNLDQRSQLQQFLHDHQGPEGIRLSAQRSLYLLTRTAL